MNNLVLKSFLLVQTAQEKTLTFLYLSLFVFTFFLLVLDAIKSKSLIEFKPMTIFFMIILVISLVALIVLLVSGYNK